MKFKSISRTCGSRQLSVYKNFNDRLEAVRTQQYIFMIAKDQFNKVEGSKWPVSFPGKKIKEISSGYLIDLYHLLSVYIWFY